jgi:hypothetical protein
MKELSRAYTRAPSTLFNSTAPRIMNSSEPAIRDCLRRRRELVDRRLWSFLRLLPAVLGALSIINRCLGNLMKLLGFRNKEIFRNGFF